MATNIWRGDAPDVAQQTTIVLGGTWAANDTITLTISDIDLVLTIGATFDLATILDNLLVMVTGSGSFGTGYSSAGDVKGNQTGVFSELGATEDGVDTLTLTAARAGRPYTLTSARVTAVAGTIVQTTTVANSSKSDFEDDLNWSNGAKPIAADDVIFEDSNVDCLYNLDQSAVAHNSFKVRQSYTGRLGLQEINRDGSIVYEEYRGTFLQTASLDIEIGQGEGTGSGRIKIDSGAAVGVVVDVQNTGGAENEALGAFIWKGTNSTNTVTCQAGTVGLGVIALDNAVMATLNVINATVVHFNGTATTTNVNGTGTLNSDATIVDFVQKGDAASKLTGSLIGAGSSITVEAGTLTDHTTGTVIDLTVMNAATYNLAGSPQTSRTVTNKADFHVGSTVNDPLGILVLTGGYTIPGGKRVDITADFGKNRSQYDVA